VINIVVAIYKLSKTFPKEELYGLTSQIMLAVTSISPNIAGVVETVQNQKRNSGDFLKLLYGQTMKL
jgi:four helix bundle protein